MGNKRNERRKRARQRVRALLGLGTNASATATAPMPPEYTFSVCPHTVGRIVPLAAPEAHAWTPPVEQWPLLSQHVADAWERFGTMGGGARVAVLDTGVDETHPALRSVVSHDCTRGRVGLGDSQGHGTHVCGIVGAGGGQIFGVAPECELHSFRVFEGAATDDATITAALREIASGKHGHFDVVNLSLGAARANEEMRLLALEMSARGTLMVCAAGNDGDHTGGEKPRFGTVEYPAEFTSSICVGSADKDRRRSVYSSTGPHMHVMAPGQEVVSAWPGGNLAVLSGTSMAAPFVTGLLALMASRCRAKGWPTPDQAEALYCLAASAQDMESPGFDPFTGFGHVDVHGCMLRLDGLRDGG